MKNIILVVISIATVLYFSGCGILSIPESCETITCSEHGVCEVKNDKAVCVCESGYYSGNKDCIPESYNYKLQKTMGAKAFYSSNNVFVDDYENIYVVTNNKVQLYDKFRNFIKTLQLNSDDTIKKVIVKDNIFLISYSFIEKFDLNGNFITKLEIDSGSDVDIDSNNYFYVLSSGEIKIYNENGIYEDSFDVESTEHAIVIDDADTVLVKYNNYIYGYSTNGLLLEKTKLISSNYDLNKFKTDEDYNIYGYSDNYGNYIEKFDSLGNFIKKIEIRDVEYLYVKNNFVYVLKSNVLEIYTSDLIYIGSLGNKEGHFNDISIFVDLNRTVYTVDYILNIVQIFDLNGNLINCFGKEGDSNGEFSYPKDITVDNYGNIYVADTGNNRIQKFDSNGNFITKWGVSGSSKRQFNKPSNIFIINDELYVLDEGNSRIQIFNLSGDFINEFIVGDQSYAETDNNGYIYAVVDYGCGMDKYDKTGISQEFSGPCITDSFAIDNLGYFYSNNEKYTKDGVKVVTKYLNQNNSEIIFSYSYYEKFINDIFVDKFGFVYIVFNGNINIFGYWFNLFTSFCLTFF